MAAKDEQDQLTEADRSFSRLMREAREREGWSQSDLARLVTDHGGDLTQATVSRIESGRRAARLGEARLIAQVLGKKLDEISSPDFRASILADMRYETNVLLKAHIALNDAAVETARARVELLQSVDLAQRGPYLEGEGSDAFDEVVRERVTEAERALAIDPFERARDLFDAEQTRVGTHGAPTDADQ